MSLPTAKVFDEHAEKYDSWYLNNRVTAKNELLLVKTVLKDKPTPCLEVGVGTGYFSLGAGCTFGIDPSPSMLSRARSRGLEVAVGVGESLPIRSSALGTVLLVVTLCFLENPLKALREVHRALRGGGYLVACIVPRSSPWGRLYLRLSLEGHIFYSVARFYDVEEVINMSRRAGFRYLRALATLRYRPWERPRHELPRDFRGGEGFVCLEFRKCEDEEARKG